MAEIVYFPLETELLRTARALGCATLDGGRMAVFQAVSAFREFTGLEPDAERMLRHFRRSWWRRAPRALDVLAADQSARNGERMLRHFGELVAARAATAA